MSYELRSARWIAADVLRQVVQPGDTVVDATLGNGHDTLMLCELVGETGRVIGFDIQPDAVERTRERLADAGMLSRCTLYAEGHEHLSERVITPIRTATFNLGWLPGGDKRITTHWETTRAAISAALSLLMKGGEGIENLQLIYLLYLLQAVTSYLLSYKNAIYQAYQKAYIRKAIDQIIGIVRLILQIVVLVTTRNFILYLIIQLFMPMLTSAIIWARADREFPYLKQYKELPEPQERKAIFKNVGALSLHKLATVIVRSTDNLIMSAFDGLATVGIYSNYKLVLMNVNNLLGHVTGAFTASIGNLNALEGRKRVYEIFRILDFAAFLLYGYLSGGLVTLINFFIRMIFGAEYLFSMTVVVIIIAEFFISGLRQMGLQFREALGLFWYDRYKALAEAIINLVVSLILVRRFGVAGIIGGTIISSLLTCVWFEPYVLMRYGIEEDWQKKLRRYFMDYIVRWVVVAGVSAVSYWIFQLMPQTNFFWFIAQGLIYTAIFAAVVLVVYGRTPEFQYLLEMTVRKLRKKLRGGA
mgnify:FL=1